MENEINTNSDTESISLSDSIINNEDIYYINEKKNLYPKFFQLNINKSIFKNEKNEDKECGICFGKIKQNDNICNLNVCDHIYHQDCLSKWYDQCIKELKSFTCPMCRKIEPLTLVDKFGILNIDSDDDMDLFENMDLSSDDEDSNIIYNNNI